MKEKLLINVRFAGLKDLEFCVFSDYKHIPKSMLKRRIEERAVILAEVGEKPVGYARLEFIWMKTPYLSNISVNREYRRKGVGTAIVNFLAEQLCRQGHKFLYSSSQANEPEPQMWHRRIGFEECGCIAGINEGGIGEIFFRKRLQSGNSPN